MDLLSAADQIVESLNRLNARTEDIATMLLQLLSAIQPPSIETGQLELEIVSSQEVQAQTDITLPGELDRQAESTVEPESGSDESPALNSEKESAQALKRPSKK